MRKIRKILVGDSLSSNISGWSFKNISKTFDKHVSKSVPFYEEGHNIITELSTFFLNDNSICYDLGCSTGSLLEKITKKNYFKEKIKYFGIDIENSMIKESKRRSKGKKNIKFINADLKKIKLKKSDLIICYYTIQFIRPKERQIIFNKIYNSLNWGGAFIFFEKVRSPDSRFQDIAVQLYNDYKLSKKYSPASILGKTSSLRGVLEPFTSAENFRLLKRAKFKDFMTIMKHICFEGFIAIK